MNNDVEENDTTYIFSPFEMYSEDISYQATKQCLQDDENMIEIYYDLYMENGNMVAQNLLNKTIDIIYFLCESADYGFKRPSSGETGILRIYIEYDEFMDDAYGSAYYDHRLITINEDGGYGVIKMNYEMLHNDLLDGSIINFYDCTLIHEIIHVIMFRYLIHLGIYNPFMPENYHNMQWFHEGIASAIGLYYYILQYGKNINSNMLFDNYTSRMNNYLKNSNITLYDRFVSNSNAELTDNYRGYHSYLFFYNIIEKYGLNFYKYFYQNYFFEVTTETNDDIIIIFDECLKEYGTSFSEEYIDFSKKNTFAKYDYSTMIGEYSKSFYSYPLNVTFDSENYFMFDNNISEMSTHYYKIPFDLVNNVYNINFQLSNYENFSLYIVALDAKNNINYYEIECIQNNFNYFLNDLKYNTKEIALMVCNKNYYVGSESYSINIERFISMNCSVTSNNQLNGHFAENYDSLICVIPIYDSGFYNIELNVSVYHEYLEEDLEIYDNNYNLIQKSEWNYDYAKNEYGANNIVCYLEGENIYYIKINYMTNDLNSNLNVVSLNSIVETNANPDFTLNEFDIYSSEFNKTEIYKSIKSFHTGEYTIDINTINELSANYTMLIYKKHGNNTTLIECEEFNTNVNLSLNVLLYEGSELFIFFIVNQNYTMTVNITIQRNIDFSFALWSDPNDNVTVGSEVSMNNGAYQGKTITQGYTRIVYINNDIMSKSRLDYFWYSSNENVAKVSEYGTVTAVSENENIVTIYAVYKADPTKVGQITFTILPDLTTYQINVALTTDVRTGGVVSGTQVTENGGLPGDVDLNVGYTRLICFYSNSPTNSIQDFIWTSSNENVVTVSEFGTIFAVGEGEAYIYGVYKYNDNFIAQMYVYVN